jgi:hypothetical protein
MGHVDNAGVAEDERETYRQEGIYTSRHQRPDYDLLNHGVSGPSQFLSLPALRLLSF